ncbi:hypothetical protein [Streptomyces sp. NPDC005017]|uniref:hypothetical protein n=1 Tax=Streptomyces sp. NPDC005017 TaxID=3364706 RepID=UPI0036CB384D
MPEYAEGQYLSWDHADGSVTTVEVMAVDRYHITYRTADDHRDTAEATVFHTLAQATAH